MIIDCISDLHGHYPKLEGVDLLIVAGDLTAKHTEEEYHWFCNRIKVENYKRVIFIAGNHDTFLTDVKPFKETRWWLGSVIGQFEYLYDSGTEFEGLKIWGSPWVAAFPGMNRNCMAFTMEVGCDTDEWLAEKWALIPDDTDILITHSPPFGVLDKVERYDKGIIENVGSKSLAARCCDLDYKLHVFGHVHEGYGILRVGDVTMVNASHVNKYYKPVNKSIRIEL